MLCVKIPTILTHFLPFYVTLFLAVSSCPFPHCHYPADERYYCFLYSISELQTQFSQNRGKAASLSPDAYFPLSLFSPLHPGGRKKKKKAALHRHAIHASWVNIWRTEILIKKSSQLSSLRGAV